MKTEIRIYMPEKMSDRMSVYIYMQFIYKYTYIYTYIYIYLYIFIYRPFIHTYNIYIYFQVMCRKLCQNFVSGSGSLDLFDRNEPSVSVMTVIGIQPQVGDPPNHLVGGFKHVDYCG